MKLPLSAVLVLASSVLVCGCGNLAGPGGPTSGASQKSTTKTVEICSTYMMDVPSDFIAETRDAVTPPPSADADPSDAIISTANDCGVHIRSLSDNRIDSGLEITVSPKMTQQQAIDKYKTLFGDQLKLELSQIFNAGPITLTRTSISTQSLDGQPISGFVMLGNDNGNNVFVDCFPTDARTLSAYEKIVASLRPRSPR